MTPEELGEITTNSVSTRRQRYEVCLPLKCLRVAAVDAEHGLEDQ
jgi:hypothetical protein